MSKVMDGLGLFSLCCFDCFLSCCSVCVSVYQFFPFSLFSTGLWFLCSVSLLLLIWLSALCSTQFFFCFMGILILMLLHFFNLRCLMFNIRFFFSTSSLCGEIVLTDIQSQLAWNLLFSCLSFLSEEFVVCAITHDWVNFYWCQQNHRRVWN